MDDTKRLIEKYKRELMELSRRSAKPAPVRSRIEEPPVPVVPDDPVPETAAEAMSETVDETMSETVDETMPETDTETMPETTSEEAAAPERKPKIIGYVSEESGEFPAVYDRFLAEIVENDESLHPGDIVETAEETEEAAEPPVSADSNNDADNNSTDDNDTDILDNSDVLFTPPQYNDVPSTQQVREDITEQSEPSDNRPEENVSGTTDNSSAAPRPDFTDVQSVSEEKAETLADQPISGTSEDEQLTGRSFEDESYPQNPAASPDSIMRQGSGTEPINYPEAVYDDYDDFVRQNIGRGSMVFRVYTAREALPVMGARCVISKTINGEVHEIYSLVTDNSGQTRAEMLPAPSRELSQSFDNGVQPFALYDATVTKRNYADVELRNIPVFDGEQSVQRVNMVPAAPDSDTAEEITEVDNAL